VPNKKADFLEPFPVKKRQPSKIMDDTDEFKIDIVN